MLDILTYALCKKYVKDSLAGAGALKGDKGSSAYDLAKKYGYTGTEQEWVASLKGSDGATPYIGTNGNWYINNTDTGVAAKATFSYNDLQDLPSINGVELKGNLEIDIPTKLSQLENDPEFITAADLPTKISQLENDSNFITSDSLPKKISELQNDTGYLTSNDISQLANKSEIPTKISQLQNDSNYLTSHQQIKTINGQSVVGTGDITLSAENAIEDVQVNGTSVVTNKIANISFDLNATIGRTFTTNTTVGFLEAGTQIQETDTLADIIYKMLFKQQIVENSTKLIFGGLDTLPVGESDLDNLDWKIEKDNIDPDSLYASTYSQLTKTGNVDEEEGQYPIIAVRKCVKPIRLQQWSALGAESIAITFNSIETENYLIYYIPTRTYDEDIGGITYVLTFVEG